MNALRADGGLYPGGVERPGLADAPAVLDIGFFHSSISHLGTGSILPPCFSYSQPTVKLAGLPRSVLAAAPIPIRPLGFWSVHPSCCARLSPSETKGPAPPGSRGNFHGTQPNSSSEPL